MLFYYQENSVPKLSSKQKHILKNKKILFNRHKSPFPSVISKIWIEKFFKFMFCLEPLVEARCSWASKPQKIQILLTVISPSSYFVPKRDIDFSGTFSYIAASWDQQ